MGAGVVVVYGSNLFLDIAQVVRQCDRQHRQRLRGQHVTNPTMVNLRTRCRVRRVARHGPRARWGVAVSGQTWWLWVAICLAAWCAAVFLIGAWLDHDDDLEQYRFPYNDDDGDDL